MSTRTRAVYVDCNSVLRVLSRWDWWCVYVGVVAIYNRLVQLLHFVPVVAVVDLHLRICGNICMSGTNATLLYSGAVL